MEKIRIILIMVKYQSQESDSKIRFLGEGNILHAVYRNVPIEYLELETLFNLIWSADVIVNVGIEGGFLSLID